jgi:hypothetical protein
MSAVFRIVLFSAALAGFVFAMLLAGSPKLHEWAHQDSGDTEHQCLATVLHAGACDDPAPTPPLVAAAEGAVEAVAEDNSRVALSLFLSCRILEHAPPAIS